MAQTARLKKRPTSFVAAKSEEGGFLTADSLRESVKIREAKAISAVSRLPPVATDLSRTTETDGRYGISHDGDFNLRASNIGFKLLKKSGWKEGTGLGAAEQGIVYPLPAYVKHGREGIGAEKEATTNIYTVLKKRSDVTPVTKATKKETNAEKRLSKRAKKARTEEQRMLEHQFTRDFLREFWPDNV